MRRRIALAAMVAVGLTACTDDNGHQLPALPGQPATYDTSNIVSPSYTSSTSTTLPEPVATPPPTPPWDNDELPPTVLVYETAAPRTAPPAPRRRATRSSEPVAVPETTPAAPRAPRRTAPPATDPPATDPPIQAPPDTEAPFRPTATNGGVTGPEASEAPPEQPPAEAEGEEG